MKLSPSWAFSGQAIDGRGDTHLAEGLHHRVVTNPLIGLPVAPLVIGRTVWTPSELKSFGRSDVLWIDSRGSVLSLPFTVAPDNPVTGHLPVGQCCWARIDARVTKSPVPVPGPVNPRLPVRPRLPLTPRLQLDRTPPVSSVRTVGLRIEGRVTTPYGDAPVAVRSAAPYDVYASHLERLVITGSGVVTGVRWIPAAAVTKVGFHTVVELPTRPGPRYTGPEGSTAALDRVKVGAPTRYGLHESPGVAGPAACDPSTPAEEVDRVDALTATLRPTLDQLVNDTSATQTALTVSEPVYDHTGRELGTSERFLLPELLHAATDPGLARWLGFLGADRKAQEDNGIVIYTVHAVFAPDWKKIDELGLRSTLPAKVDDPVEAIVRLIDGMDLSWLKDLSVDLKTSAHLVMGVVLAATVGAPLDLPSSPGLSVGTDGPWLPGTAPQARRELSATLAALVAGAGLASAIAQPNGTAAAARNPVDGRGRGRLITPGRSLVATGPTDGEVRDRLTDDRGGSWQVAQIDWFGRWSGWSRRGFVAGVRPQPPSPVLTATTRPPTVPQPSPGGPLAGVVRVEVAVPPVAGLPAGGRLLDDLELTVRSAGLPATVTRHPLSDPAHPPETLVIEVPGPELLPTRSGQVTLTARWLDTANVASNPSSPRTVTLHDPRPPAAVVLSPTLTYTARPDATGHAQTTLAWTSTEDQPYFRVFVADETTLRAKLADIAAGRPSPGDSGQAPPAADAAALLTALDTAAGDPARGAVWADHRHQLPRRWWLQLTGEPLARVTGGPTRYTHEVSGSLTVLVLYRIVSVSAASVESDFATSPLLPRRVPNALVPATPAITVRPETDGAQNLIARITVAVPSGPAAAARYRLRRATGSTATMLMPIVAEGAVPTDAPTDMPTDMPTAANRPQTFHVVDHGDGPQGPRSSLNPWLRYHWRLEVQGPPAPGGGPAGEWSPASAVASTVTMPTAAPAPVAALAISQDGAGRHVRFTHPEPLSGGATTGYVVDVYRQRPGEVMRLLTSVPGQAPPPVGRGTLVTGTFDVVDAEPVLPSGTAYRVVVTDPIGRASTPSAAVVLP